MSRLVRLTAVAALAAAPLLGTTAAHADHCEGDMPQAVLDACSAVNGAYCTVITTVAGDIDEIDSQCRHIRFAS